MILEIKKAMVERVTYKDGTLTITGAENGDEEFTIIFKGMHYLAVLELCKGAAEAAYEAINDAEERR